MKRAPDLAAINAAEQRVMQSARDIDISLCRARVAVRTTLTRSSTLLMILGATGIVGFWLARRRKALPVASSDSAIITPRRSAAALMLGFVVQQAMQRLPLILHHFWTAQRERSATPARHADRAD